MTEYQITKLLIKKAKGLVRILELKSLPKLRVGKRVNDCLILKN